MLFLGTTSTSLHRQLCSYAILKEFRVKSKPREDTILKRTAIKQTTYLSEYNFRKLISFDYPEEKVFPYILSALQFQYTRTPTVEISVTIYCLLDKQDLLNDFFLEHMIQCAPS
jgi:hypothetical protein